MTVLNSDLTKSDLLEIEHIGEQIPLNELMRAAASLRDDHHGHRVTYSRKVFIPLTHLCRDVCHYCTFATSPNKHKRVYLQPDEILTLARSAKAKGCKEALFTLGDKPELRYAVARRCHGHGQRSLKYLKCWGRSL